MIRALREIAIPFQEEASVALRLVHTCDANARGSTSDVHTSNANASRVRYARAFQYPKMAAILFPESALPLTSSREKRTLETRLKMAEEDATLA